MKNKLVVLLTVLGLAMAGYAEAAKPKKRTRNANRIGPYAVGFVAQTSYTSDMSEDEALAVDFLESVEPLAIQNLTSSTDDSGVGYQAAFGYRFLRNLAAEISLVQLGKATSRASADMDFGSGVVPANLALSFNAGGPMVSVIGILPVNDRFELFGRAGFLFTSAKREVRLRVDGQNAGFASAKGESQDLVFGVGASYNVNQMYAVRLEYLKLDDLGEREVSGTEDADQIGLGIVVRF